MKQQLAEIVARKLSGSWKLRHESGADSQVLFRNGRVVSVLSSPVPHNLAEELLAFGDVSLDKVQAALRESRERGQPIESSMQRFLGLESTDVDRMLEEVLHRRMVDLLQKGVVEETFAPSAPVEWGEDLRTLAVPEDEVFLASGIALATALPGDAAIEGEGQTGPREFEGTLTTPERDIQSSETLRLSQLSSEDRAILDEAFVWLKDAFHPSEVIFSILRLAVRFFSRGLIVRRDAGEISVFGGFGWSKEEFVEDFEERLRNLPEEILFPKETSVLMSTEESLLTALFANSSEIAPLEAWLSPCVSMLDDHLPMAAVYLDQGANRALQGSGEVVLDLFVHEAARHLERRSLHETLDQLDELKVEKPT